MQRRGSQTLQRLHSLQPCQLHGTVPVQGVDPPQQLSDSCPTIASLLRPRIEVSCTRAGPVQVPGLGQSRLRSRRPRSQVAEQEDQGPQGAQSPDPHSLHDSRCSCTPPGPSPESHSRSVVDSELRKGDTGAVGAEAVPLPDAIGTAVAAVTPAPRTPPTPAAAKEGLRAECECGIGNLSLGHCGA